MGILLSALAAAGDEGVRSINSNIAQQNAMELEKQRQDLAEQKAKSVADYTNLLAIKTADAQREAGVARGQAALTGIVNQQMGNNWAASDKAAADLSLTDEQKTAIEQTKKSERFKLENDPLNMLIADAKTGDLKKSDLAKLLIDQNRQQANAAAEARKAAFDEWRMENGEERNRIRDKQVDVNSRKVDALFAKIYSRDNEDKKPAEIVATEWLIKNKDDPIAMAAYDKQRESKSKNIINLAADIFARDPNKGTKSGISTADAISQAKEFYNEFKTIPETKVPDAALPIVPSKRPLSDFDRK